MSLLILHLSDIHFVDGQNQICDRVKEICAAVRSIENEFEACLIAVTGDVAFGGMSSQYQTAYVFFDELQTAICSLYGGIPATCVFVPGNHDCNFDIETDARPVLLESIEREIERIDPSGEIARQCLSIQKEFFEFEARFHNNSAVPETNQIYYERFVTLDGMGISVKCFNTAWLSRKKEDQGRLFFPIHIVGNSDAIEQNHHLSLALFHHPYTWSNADNSLVFKSLIEQSADIILSGHEHTENYYRKQMISGEEVHYLEGAVLQDSQGRQSGFNTLLVDLEHNRHRIIQFSWSKDHYKRKRQTEWLPFVRNKILLRSKFENNSLFLDELLSTGSEFTRSEKKQITLPDIFIYPDLSEIAVRHKLKSMTGSPVIRGNDVIDRLCAQTYILITGDEQIGKTSLARSVYLDLQRRKGLIPLLIQGEILKKTDDDHFASIVREACGKQYSAEKHEQFRQLETDQRVLIIDDLHKARLNSRGRKILIHKAKRFFGQIIVFADKAFQMEELSRHGHEDSLHSELDHYDIRQFNNRLKGQLIQKWVGMGREYSLEANAFLYEVGRMENLVNTMLGKNLLPSYPIFILSILQAYEANVPHKLEKGSYGSLYEVLITTALSTVSQESTDLDKLHAFIPRLAYYLYQFEKQSLSHSDFIRICDEYHEQYKMQIDSTRMLDDLQKARILCRSGDGYGFRHKCFYFYFVARYFQENLAGNREERERLRSQLREMAGRVTYQDYAQILMFYVYLTKDREIIEQMLDHAGKIYSDHQPCNLESHVSFFNHQKPTPHRIALPESSALENREQLREINDELNGEDRDDDELAENSPEQENLDLIKINLAFKTLEIIGQILRNFPYSLRADLKLEIAREGFLLGLRTIKMFLDRFENDWTDFRDALIPLLEEKHNTESKADLSRRIEQLMTFLTTQITVSIIQKVSRSIGHEKLDEIYREVSQSDAQTAIDLINLCIRLDHSDGFPESEIRRMHKKLQGNIFTFIVLRDIIADYLYLYDCRYDRKQMLGQLFDIDTSSPRLLEAPLLK